MHINSREIKNQIGFERTPDPVQSLLQQCKIFLIATACFKPDIKTALLFHRIVLLFMHREGKHRPISSENMSGAISLVNIKVNNENLFHQFFFLQPADCYSDIVDVAEAFSMFGKGMMKAAAQIHRPPCFQSFPGGL